MIHSGYNLRRWACCTRLLLISLALTNLPQAARAADPYDLNDETYEMEMVWSTPANGWNFHSWNVQVASYGNYTYVVYEHDPLGQGIEAHVAQIDSAGNATDIRLGADIDYHVLSDNHHQFSIGVDERGYIYVCGDMHHYPQRNTAHLPAGLSTFWRSEFPEDISSFINGASAANSGKGTSYASYFNDANGRLLFTHRKEIKTGLKNNVALRRLNTTTDTWEDIGAVAPTNYLTFMWEDNTKSGTNYARVRGWGVADANNRIHFVTAILNENYSGSNVNTTELYARSLPNDVTTWTKADGSIIQLPIRAEAGAFQADIVNDHKWMSTDSSVAVDQEQNAFIVFRNKSNAPTGGFLKGWDGNTWQDYTPKLPQSLNSFRIYNDGMGILTITNGNNLLRCWHPDRGFRTVSMPWSITHVDRQMLRRNGTIQGVGRGGQGFALYRVKLTRPIPQPSAYDQWIDSYYPSETDLAIIGVNADPNKDGLSNIFAFIGASEPNQNNPNNTLTITSDETYAICKFPRSDRAAYLAPEVQHSENLSVWTNAEHGVDGVLIEVEDDGFGTDADGFGIDRITVKIPHNDRVRWFCRLAVDVTQ